MAKTVANRLARAVGTLTSSATQEGLIEGYIPRDVPMAHDGGYRHSPDSNRKLSRFDSGTESQLIQDTCGQYTHACQTSPNIGTAFLC